MGGCIARIAPSDFEDVTLATCDVSRGASAARSGRDTAGYDDKTKAVDQDRVHCSSQNAAQQGCSPGTDIDIDRSASQAFPTLYAPVFGHGTSN